MEGPSFNQQGGGAGFFEACGRDDWFLNIFSQESRMKGNRTIPLLNFILEKNSHKGYFRFWKVRQLSIQKTLFPNSSVSLPRLVGTLRDGGCVLPLSGASLGVAIPSSPRPLMTARRREGGGARV